MSNKGKLITDAGVEVDIDDLGLPAGGATGHVLTKVSNADADADWEAAAGGGSQPSPIIRVPVAFDGADNLTGFTVYNALAGDFWPYVRVGTTNLLAWRVQLSPVWDGSTPQLRITTRAELGSTDLFTISLDNTDLDPANQQYLDEVSSVTAACFLDPNGSGPYVVTSPVEIVAVIDDGSGGDPGAMQGAGELILTVQQLPA